MSSGNIAIIGAGMAGLTAARVLTDAGANVTLFDKGRKPGGRLATRHVEGFTFNHGCQFFSSRDPDFWRDVGPVAAAWPAAGTDRYAGVPDMSSIAARLSETLAPRQHAHLRAVSRNPEGWLLTFDTGLEGPFETLILAIPAPQAALLLADMHRPFAAALGAVHLAPCWSVMLGFATPFDDPQTGKRDAGPIAWLAAENSRPGATATAPAAYTIHASASWSQKHLEADSATVIAALAKAANFTSQPVHAAAHRWRYALADKPLGEPFLWDASETLGLCGDWCLGGRLEAAYLSGRALGIRLTQ